MALNLPSQNEVAEMRARKGETYRSAKDFTSRPEAQAERVSAAKAVMASYEPNKDKERRLDSDNKPNNFDAMKERMVELGDEISALRKRIDELENKVSTSLKPKERKAKIKPVSTDPPSVDDVERIRKLKAASNRKRRAEKWLAENPTADKPEWVVKAISEFNLDVVE